MRIENARLLQLQLLLLFWRCCCSCRCYECGEMKRKDAFTKAQWKQDTYRVCKECTTQKREAGTPYRCTQCGLWHAACHFASKHQNPRWSMYRVCLTCDAVKQCCVCKKTNEGTFWPRSMEYEETGTKSLLAMPNQNSWFLEVRGLPTPKAPAPIFHVYLQAVLWRKWNADVQHMLHCHCAGCYPQTCCHVCHNTTGTSSQKSPPQADVMWHLGSDCTTPPQSQASSQWHHHNPCFTDKRGHERMPRSNKYHITNVCLSSLRESYKIHHGVRKSPRTRTLRSTVSCPRWCSMQAVYALLPDLQHKGDNNQITWTHSSEAQKSYRTIL